ncbi:hypothetical protein NBRC116601_18310 [Cognatishimia sp. WU-CL00825]|uniref:hypothetical protein n=1 Tax=Cognatishimia sp. WU-CL00825 TaxID=3127658 RepID=UPI003107D955
MGSAKPKQLTEMTCGQARSFLLKSENYFDFDLPKYYNFDALLTAIDWKLDGRHINGIWTQKPGDLEGLNHVIFAQQRW